MILLASQPIEDLDALANAGTISVEEQQFYAAVQAAGNDLSLLQFNRAQFAAGYTQFVDPNRYKPEGATSEQRTVPVRDVKAKVKARLSEQGFDHIDTTYQGVPAIKATLGSFTGYVIFVPAYWDFDTIWGDFRLKPIRDIAFRSNRHKSTNPRGFRLFLGSDLNPSPSKAFSLKMG